MRTEAVLAGVVAALGLGTIAALIAFQGQKSELPGQQTPISSEASPTASPAVSPTTVSPTPSLSPTSTPIKPPTSTTPARSAVLVGADPRVRINVRSAPSTQAEVVEAGWMGDRINVVGESRGPDGYIWYYIKFNSSKKEGWVHSTLVSLVESPSKPTPASPNPGNSTLNTVLQGCKRWVESDLGGARVQVFPNPRLENGIYVVSWSASNGADGYCRVERSGNVIEYVNYSANDRPPDFINATNIALVGCRRRVEREVSSARIDVQPDSRLSDGTFMIDWRASSGAEGYCRVTRSGTVLEFVNYAAASRPEEVALSRCKRRAEQASPGARIEVLLDPRDRSSFYKVNWISSTGVTGYCRVDRDGKLVAFVNNSQIDDSAREARRDELQQEFENRFVDRDIDEVKKDLQQEGYAFNDNGQGQMTFRADRGTFQVQLSYRLPRYTISQVEVW